MCLAISKPAGAIIPVEHLQSGYSGNPHGCGFCYSENGKLTIVKGLFSFEDFYEQYKEKEHLAMLIHFRFSTHGKPNYINCHPFDILNGQYALIHNGVIKIHCSIPHLSDTGNFSRLIMEPMLKLGVTPEKPAFRYLVESAIGEGNKVCLMAADGSVTIYNEESGSSEDAVDKDDNDIMIKVKNKKGEEIEDNLKVWYSHSGYKYCRSRNKRSRYEDEYEGFFNCGQGEEAVTEEELIAAGFTDNRSSENFTNRAKLDQPPTPEGVVEGFKAGVKQTKNDSDEVLKVYDAITHRTPGRYPPETGQSSFDTKEIAEITSGPIFDAQTELEIAFLQEKSGVTRGEAIQSMQLEPQDAISYVS